MGTQVIILAAGQGKRLRPLTDHIPKSLVPLDGISILDRQIKTFNQLGLKSIHVVTGYLRDQISTRPVQIHVNDRYESTNMVSSLFRAESVLEGSDDIIISYGDIIFSERVLSRVLSSNSNLGVVVDLDWLSYWGKRFSDPLLDAESLVIRNGLIVDIGQKIHKVEEADAQFIGLLKIRSEYLPRFVDHYKNLAAYLGHETLDAMFMTDLLQNMIEKKEPLTPIGISGEWAEIDSALDVSIAEERLCSFNTSGQAQIDN